MSLSKGLNYWLILNLFFLFLTVVLGTDDFEQLRLIVFGISFLSILVFYLVSFKTLQAHKNSYYTGKRIVSILLPISVLFVVLYNISFFYHNNSFFAYDAYDTLQYDNWSRWMIRYDFISSIQEYVARGYDIEDLGAAMITSLSYRIYPSTLVLNTVNIIAGIVSALSIYRISQVFMSRKYAYYASISYGLSSFVLYAYATGFKETFFVMFVLLFFENLIKYWKERKPQYLFLGLLFLSSLYFFRPAVLAMIILAVIIGFLFEKNRGIYIYSLIGIVGLIVVLNIEQINKLIELYQLVTDPKNITSEQELGYSTFNIFASYISSAFGPFPSYSPLVGREQQAFYAVGVSLRVLLAVPFWIGLKKTVQERNSILIMMYAFIIMEMFILAAILESFELRFSLPHIPFVYIIGFYVLYKANNGTRFKFNGTLKNAFFILIISMLIAWNIRFIL